MQGLHHIFDEAHGQAVLVLELQVSLGPEIRCHFLHQGSTALHWRIDANVVGKGRVIEEYLAVLESWQAVAHDLLGPGVQFAGKGPDVAERHAARFWGCVDVGRDWVWLIHDGVDFYAAIPDMQAQHAKPLDIHK